MTKRNMLRIAASDSAVLTELGLKVGQRVTYTLTGETALVVSASRSEASGGCMVVVGATCGGHMHVPSSHVKEAK